GGPAPRLGGSAAGGGGGAGRAFGRTRVPARPATGAFRPRLRRPAVRRGPLGHGDRTTRRLAGACSLAVRGGAAATQHRARRRLAAASRGRQPRSAPRALPAGRLNSSGRG